MVYTVRGPVDGADLGFTLMHEHVIFRDTEFSKDYPDLSWQPDRAAALNRAVTGLRAAVDAGVRTIVDCTAFFHGRDLDFVREVNERVDVNIVVATGIYTFDYLPNMIARRTLRGPDDRDILTEMFVRDITGGIGDSGIRAQIIKVATDLEGITPNNGRILRAAARAHRETGAPITTHTQPLKRNGLDQQRLFASEGVDLSRVVIGHSGDTTDLDYLMALMDGGSTTGHDRFGLYLPGWASLPERVETIATLCERGYSDRIVLSHDSILHNDRNDYASPRMEPLPDWRMTHVPADVVPLLRERGVSEADLANLTVNVPRRILEAGPAY
ncbi:phosphotriesterase-related protein [Asanoa ferruginea]|uniref:Phosphotriesterase-related protein n=1 Tax=Asanoa ferruginea TaxID=53367 RepID=A0A3D9ZM95_9ACTN|nr:phosphotriesterase-related protein [Asanoa ferruginea]REF98331.1 phosphotriesterase-related protein [Asanoa ferruginea]GIF52770.1 phosphotriesterase [Asanoa ferruginea]